MKKILFSIIFLVSWMLLSCASSTISSNSTENSTYSISSNPTPETSLLLPEASPPLLEDQTQTELNNSVEPTLLEDSTTSKEIADAVTKQFPEPTPVVILPTRGDYLDDSEEAVAIAENAAAQLRQSGYTVQTSREANVASAIGKTIGHSKLVSRTSIGRLGTALGIGAIILVGLATAEENEMSVTTSIYANNRGVFEEISKSNLRTTETNNISQQRTSQCTKNLLVNGDFEKDWDRGWTRTYADLEQGSSITEIVNQNSKTLHMKHEGLAGVSLHQIVPVPRGNIFFQFETKFVAREGPIGGFTGTGTAGVTIIFLDAKKDALGLIWVGSLKKNIFEGTGLVGVPLSPQSNNSAAFITLENNQTVSDRIEISRIAKDRLGKLDLSKIKYVAVSISVGATHRSASAEAWVDNLSLEVCS